MPNGGKFVIEIADQIESVVRAARSMLGAYPIRFFDWTEQGGVEAHAWAMLVRTVNLGEAALQAARSGHGEVIALIARCLQEMTFTVKRLGPDLAGGRDFILYSLGTQKKTVQKFMKATSDTAHRCANEEAARRLEQLIGGERTEWEKHIEQRAKKAGMGEDYATCYGFLCEQAHTDGHALLYYTVRAKDGAEVHQRVWPTAAATYLLITADYFVRLITMLLRVFPLKEQATFRASAKGLDEYVAILDASQWMKMPVTIDWGGR